MSVLIVILLAGMWPDSLSFSDEKMEPVPTKWKGDCQNGTAFDSSRCNSRHCFSLYHLWI